MLVSTKEFLSVFPPTKALLCWLTSQTSCPIPKLHRQQPKRQLSNYKQQSSHYLIFYFSFSSLSSLHLSHLSLLDHMARGEQMERVISWGMLAMLSVEITRIKKRFLTSFRCLYNVIKFQRSGHKTETPRILSMSACLLRCVQAYLHLYVYVNQRHY